MVSNLLILLNIISNFYVLHNKFLIYFITESYVFHKTLHDTEEDICTFQSVDDTLQYSGILDKYTHTFVHTSPLDNLFDKSVLSKC